MKETELAACIVRYLQDRGWETHEEVSFGSGVIDIVGVWLSIVCVVECKMSFGLPVITQAWRWRDSANLVYVATPKARRSGAWDFGELTLRRHGIGHIVFDASRRVRDLHAEYGWSPSPVWETVMPETRRITCYDKWTKTLSYDRTGYARAGSAHGGHHTRFKQTMINIQRYVESHPGCRPKDIRENVGSHYEGRYATTSTIPGNIAAGFLRGVEVLGSGRSIQYYPKTEKGNRHD